MISVPLPAYALRSAAPVRRKPPGSAGNGVVIGNDAVVISGTLHAVMNQLSQLLFLSRNGIRRTDRPISNGAARDVIPLRRLLPHSLAVVTTNFTTRIQPASVQRVVHSGNGSRSPVRAIT